MSDVNKDHLQTSIEYLASKLDQDIKELQNLTTQLGLIDSEIEYVVEWVNVPECEYMPKRLWTNKSFVDASEALSLFCSIPASCCPKMYKVYGGF